MTSDERDDMDDTDALRAAAEEHLHTTTALRHALGSIRGRAANRDGTVRAEVNGEGLLLDLRLHPDCAGRTAGELAVDIERTVKLATVDAADTAHEIVAAGLPAAHRAALAEWAEIPRHTEGRQQVDTTTPVGEIPR